MTTINVDIKVNEAALLASRKKRLAVKTTSNPVREHPTSQYGQKTLDPKSK